MNYPDLLTGQSTPYGTGINIFRDGKVVFAATLTHESLALVLPLMHMAHAPHCQCVTIDAYRDGCPVLSIRVGGGALDVILPIIQAIAASHGTCPQPASPPQPVPCPPTKPCAHRRCRAIIGTSCVSICDDCGAVVPWKINHAMPLLCDCDHLQRCGDHYRCLKCGNVILVASCFSRST